LFVNNQVMSPIRFDETGALVGSHAAPVYTMTGTSSSGMFGGGNCSDWTSTSASMAAVAADPAAGPFWWSPNGFINLTCDQPGHLICMGKARTAPLPVPIISGKLVWLSATPPGFPSPDQHRQSTRPASVTTAKALIARSTAPASSVVEAGTS